MGSEEDVKGSEKDGVGSTNDQETILDSKVVGESHQDSEENEENISTENKMDDGLSQKDDSGTVGGASKPSFTSMPPPSIPVARLTRIGKEDTLKAVCVFVSELLCRSNTSVKNV